MSVDGPRRTVMERAVAIVSKMLQIVSGHILFYHAGEPHYR